MRLVPHFLSQITWQQKHTFKKIKRHSVKEGIETQTACKKWMKNLGLVEERHQSINFGQPALKNPHLEA
jgi:hypothetical protein